jgi:nucleolar protein 14
MKLTHMNVSDTAQAFLEKLVIMEKNLMRGLTNASHAEDAKTWPGLGELTILRLIGVLWSTSDMKHAVVGPARLLMGAYLELGRIRSIADLASGLFICSLFAQASLIVNATTSMLML